MSKVHGSVISTEDINACNQQRRLQFVYLTLKKVIGLANLNCRLAVSNSYIHHTNVFWIIRQRTESKYEIMPRKLKTAIDNLFLIFQFFIKKINPMSGKKILKVTLFLKLF